LTQECKNILDKIKDKSEERKKQYGVDQGEDTSNSHHKPFPPHIKDAIQTTKDDVSVYFYFCFNYLYFSFQN